MRAEQTNLNNNNINKFEGVGPRRPAKSEVWKSFGFKRYQNKAVDYCTVFCKVCDRGFKYNSTTTNMKHHFTSKHPVETENDDVTQPKASQFFLNKEPKKQKYPKRHPMHKKSRSIIVKWVCKRNRPFGITEDPEFLELCDLLDPKFLLPTRSTVTRDV